MKPAKPKVKAAAIGGGIGAAASPLLQIAVYYATPLVPADIREPVFLLAGMALTGLLGALGAFVAGYLKSEE